MLTSLYDNDENRSEKECTINGDIKKNLNDVDTKIQTAMFFD